MWESGIWNTDNIRGLYPAVTYNIRVVALHGDFTETPPGPALTVATVQPSATLDIDIATLFTDETTAPYNISLATLSPETAVFSTQNIKVDYATNARNGAVVYVADLYNGLRSPSHNTTLSSSTEDLSLSTSGDGFGLQYVSSQEAASSTGKAVARAPFVGSGAEVGAVQSAVATPIACSVTSILDTCTTGTHSWITNGSVMFKIGAKSTLANRAAADYTDSLFFTLVGNW